MLIRSPKSILIKQWTLTKLRSVSARRMYREMFPHMLKLYLAAGARALLTSSSESVLISGLVQTYEFFVVIESIRKFNHAVPFVPYEIHTVSGETYEVPHPDFIMVAPRGSFVVVFDPNDPKDTPHHISALLIERAALLDGQKRRRTRKR
jgi:hypothetical protein